MWLIDEEYHRPLFLWLCEMVFFGCVKRFRNEVEFLSNAANCDSTRGGDRLCSFGGCLFSFLRWFAGGAPGCLVGGLLLGLAFKLCRRLAEFALLGLLPGGTFQSCWQLVGSALLGLLLGFACQLLLASAGSALLGLILGVIFSGF